MQQIKRVLTENKAGTSIAPSHREFFRTTQLQSPTPNLIFYFGAHAVGVTLDETLHSRMRDVLQEKLLQSQREN